MPSTISQQIPKSIWTSTTRIEKVVSDEDMIAHGFREMTQEESTKYTHSFECSDTSIVQRLIKMIMRRGSS